MKRIFLDFEFMEDGKTIDPLSIGLVDEKGNTYYAVFKEADISKANPWVVENVLKYLNFDEAKSTEQIKKEIVRFCEGVTEFWGYYSDYDWVTLCQIFGRMIDLPSGWPMYCLDVKQSMHILKIKKDDLKYPKNEKEHNALEDAIEIMNMYHAIDAKLMDDLFKDGESQL